MTGRRVEDLTDRRGGSFARGADITQSEGKPLPHGRTIRVAEHKTDNRVRVLEATWSAGAPLVVDLAGLMHVGCRDADEAERVAADLLERADRGAFDTGEIRLSRGGNPA